MRPSKISSAAGVFCLLGGSLAALVQYLVTPVSGNLPVQDPLSQASNRQTPPDGRFKSC